MSRAEAFVHPSSTVHPHARLEAGVWVGPRCTIGERVVIGKNTRLDDAIHIEGGTEIGADCRFSPFSVIGTGPQDVGYKEEETRLVIGDRNIFREFITVHRGTLKGGGKTTIGNDNYFMAYSHVAHDCCVGNGTVFINAATIGGHVLVDDYAVISAFTSVHQFCRIGKYAYIGGFSVITQDVLPFCRVAGMRPVLFYGLNSVGLRRRGFSRERLSVLKEIYKLIFHSDLNTSQAVEKIKTVFPPDEDREEILRFIQASTRGIIKKKPRELWESESEL
jgi:UDP-N-acetylglucosamine acyltransferase